MQHRRAERYALFEKLPVGGHIRRVHESTPDAVISEIICNGKHAHAQMVRHAAAHLFALGRSAARGGEVERLEKSVACPHAALFEPTQIGNGGAGVNGEGEKACIRRQYKLCVLAALERKPSTAVSLVAVVKRRVERVKRAFGYAPRTAAAAALFLNVNAEFRRFVQQTVLRQRQEKLRHEILKHRASPACHAAVAARRAHCARQPAPVPARHVAFGYGGVARKARLACHEVVKPRRGRAFFEVYADVHKAAPDAVKYRKIHIGNKPASAFGKLAKPNGIEPVLQRDQTCAQISAIDRGQILWLERAQRTRVVPVAEMSAEARKLFQRIEHVFYKLLGTCKVYYPKLLRAHCRAQCKPDVSGRCAMCDADGRLLLKIIRRQEIILRGAECVKIAPYLLRTADKVSAFLR